MEWTEVAQHSMVYLVLLGLIIFLAWVACLDDKF